MWVHNKVIYCRLHRSIPDSSSQQTAGQFCTLVIKLAWVGVSRDDSGGALVVKPIVYLDDNIVQLYLKLGISEHKFTVTPNQVQSQD